MRSERVEIRIGELEFKISCIESQNLDTGLVNIESIAHSATLPIVDKQVENLRRVLMTVSELGLESTLTPKQKSSLISVIESAIPDIEVIGPERIMPY
jgi:hypothetical protein